MAQDFLNYAFSFGHAIVRVNERQFLGVQSVNVNQELTESAIYGTDQRPLKRSLGQLSMGRGQLVFSDYQEGTDFFAYLGTNPFNALWALDYTLSREDGTTRSIECRSCRVLGFGVEHESGPDGLSITFPFSFMAMRVEGRDLTLSPKGIAQAAINIAQNLVNLL
jgi:hypothetical protein